MRAEFQTAGSGSITCPTCGDKVTLVSVSSYPPPERIVLCFYCSTCRSHHDLVIAPDDAGNPVDAKAAWVR